MVVILGISAFYHDSAACLVIDGEIVAAAQEERFSRKKHDADFPARAVAACLAEAGVTSQQLDYIAFYDKPLAKFDRILETYVGFAPAGFQSFSRAIPLWLKRKLHMRRLIRSELRCGDVPIVFLEHHESHAASAFFPSPFQSAAILTLDGVGEWATTTLGRGDGNRIDLFSEIRFPHSLGLLYSAFTYYCGFKVNSGEYKLMGLAPYGQPLHVQRIYEHLIDVKPDGSFWLNMDFFNYCQGLTMTNDRFHALFEGAPRDPETPILQRHMDLAASIQEVTEAVVLRLGTTLYQTTGEKNLVMAGGVALNCVANGRLLREGPFANIWVQPAAGDAGGALGSALFVWHQLLDKARAARSDDAQHGSLLGPAVGEHAIRSFLDSVGARYVRMEEGDLLQCVAEAIAAEEVVGWFQGRMEFGPRALGSRSILGDARSSRMQALMNLKIKFRESFRPFAPAVLREHVAEWFDVSASYDSPYMLLVAEVKEEHRRAPSEEERQLLADPDLRHRVSVVRSAIPAVTHVDYSARIQTVDAERNPMFHRLLRTFEELTGCPVVVNTSFNVRGEPIVATPEDAYRCFLATEMDRLAIGPFVVTKSGDEDISARNAHLAQFELD